MSRITRSLLAVALAGAWLAGCARNPVSNKLELRIIPESQEIAIGTEAAPQFEKEFGGAVADAKVQSYVAALGKKLAAKSHRPKLPWEFKVVKHTTPNAFALPGGKVFVTAGLMGSLDSERQLAAVIGHEISHICHGHNVKMMQQQMGAELFASVVGKVVESSDAQSAAKLAASMGMLHYSRKHEYEADALGIVYMEKAGYNPWGMVDTLEFLLKLGGEEGGKFSEMFATHPLTSERVKAATARTETDYARYKRSGTAANDQQFLQIRGLLPR